MQKTSTRTLYDYWNGLRGARGAPDRREIDPIKIRGALAYTFILEADAEGGFNFRLAGSHLCTAYARELKGRSFSRLWHQRDRDAVDTLIKAVTEDHAVALINFSGTSVPANKVPFELLLLPLRHNGSTQTRILGAMTALDEPYWLGVDPLLDQRITGLRLIWPNETGADRRPRELSATVHDSLAPIEADASGAMPVTVNGRSARRYAHLAVIDGGRG